MELGDNKSYQVKGIGSSSMKLEDGSNIHLNNILFIPDTSIEQAKVIGIREGRFYKLISPIKHALVHTEISPCELWHRRFGHLHFKILPTLNSIVDGIPNLKEDHEGVCKGCTLGKNTKRPFGSSASRSKEILDLFTLMYVALCLPNHLEVIFIISHS